MSLPAHHVIAHGKAAAPIPTSAQQAATQTAPAGVARPEVATVPSSAAPSASAAPAVGVSTGALSGSPKGHGDGGSQGFSFSVSGQSLNILGSDASDSLYLQAVLGHLFFSTTGSVGSYAEVIPQGGNGQGYKITSGSRIQVDLGEGDDTLHLQAGLVAALQGQGASLQFDGGKGADALVGPTADTAWQVTSHNQGTLGRQIGFTSVESLRGAADNQDTFTFEIGGRLDGVVDGGLGGFDTMVINGQHASMTSIPSGPNSGTIGLDGDSSVIHYAGLEPITLSGPTTDVVVSGSVGDDQLVLEVDPGDATKLRVRSTTGTLESVSFLKPTGSLQVNGGAGLDSITVPAGQAINLPGADVTFTAESITLTDATLQGRNISFSAVASATATPTGNGLTNITLAPTAVVKIGGATSITASGNLTILASSSAALTASATALTVGLVNTDAAVVTASVTSTAQVHIFGTASLTVTGALSLSSVNSVNVQATANGGAGGPSAAGGSVAFADVTVVSSTLIDGSATVHANTITLLSTSDSTVATTALSTRLGATNNPTAALLLGQFKPATANGPVTIAAALAITHLNSTTTADLASSGTIVSNGAVSVTSQPFTSSDAKADARSVNSSTGVGAAVALDLVSADATAVVAGQLQATGLTVRAAVPPRLMPQPTATVSRRRRSLVPGRPAWGWRGLSL